MADSSDALYAPVLVALRMERASVIFSLDHGCVDRACITTCGVLWTSRTVVVAGVGACSATVALGEYQGVAKARWLLRHHDDVML